MKTHHYHIKKAFNNLLFSYIIMLLLPTVSIILLYQQAYKMAATNCINNSLSLLQSTQSYIRERINTLDNIAMQTAYDPTVITALKINHPSPGSPEVYKILKLNNYFNNKLGSNLNYYMHYQILSKNNEVIYFNDGVNFGIKSYFERTANHLDMTYEEWYDQTFNAPNRSLLPNQSVRLYNYTADAITYNFPIRISNSDEVQGALQFIIPQSALLPLIPENSSQGSYYLLNAEGQLISSTGEFKLISPYIGDMNELNGYLNAVINNKKHLIVFSKDPDTHLTLAAIYSEAFVLKDAKTIRFTALLALFICILVEILLIIWITWRNAIPIHNFSKNLSLLLTNEAAPSALNTDNEYEALHQGILTLQETKHSMTSIHEEKIQLEKSIFLKQLIEGYYKSDEQILSLAQSLNFNLSFTEHYVISLKMQGISAFKSKLQSFFKEHVAASFILHPLEENLLVMIVLFPDADCPANQEALLSSINQLLLTHPSFEHLKVGISKSHTSLTDIPLAYNQCEYCFRFTAEDKPVICYEDIMSNLHFPYYPTQLENLLSSAVKLREEDKIRAIFEQLRAENLIKRHLSSAMESILIANIQLTLFKLYEDILSAYSIEPLLKELRKLSSIEELMSRLEQEFIALAERDKSKRTERNHHFCSLIAEYMKTHYGESDLCLASIAAYFNLSESYFSQFYKESFGENFSTALESIRLNRAKELILENQLEIEKIAQQVGYTNSTTFRRAFKRLTGLSPSAFKQQNLHN